MVSAKEAQALVGARCAASTPRLVKRSKFRITRGDAPTAAAPTAPTAAAPPSKSVFSRLFGIDLPLSVRLQAMRLLNQLLYQSTDAIEAFLSPAADAITAKVAPVQAVAAALIAGHRLEQRHKYGSKKKGGVGDAASADDEDQEELMNLSELALRCFAGSFARHEPAAQMMLDHALGVSFLHPDTHFSHMSHPILPIFQNLIRFLPRSGSRCRTPS